VSGILCLHASMINAIMKKGLTGLSWPTFALLPCEDTVSDFLLTFHHLKVQQETFTRHSTCHHLVLDFPTSRTVKSKSLSFTN
jgi:hypothetical protein